jgi:methylase of polypeptide subunit release factors
LINRLLASLGASELEKHADLLKCSGSGIFQPTATTAFLLSKALEYSQNADNILDLGCGWGVIGLELALRNQEKQKVFLSDLSATAVEACQFNSTMLLLNNTEIRKGSLYEPWQNHKFDLIISDVSGISSEAPMRNLWFADIPLDSNRDGLGLISQVLQQSKNYLFSKNSKVLMPAISLSNIPKMQTLIHENDWKYKVIKENHWLIPRPNHNEMEIMLDLRKSEDIHFELRGDKLVLTTQILELTR